MRHLEGVSDAKVNFGAAKLTVSGEATIDELEKAGAFEGIRVRPEHGQPETPVSFWKQKANWNVYASIVLLITSLLFAGVAGMDHPATTIGFLLAIILGGYSLFQKGFRNLATFTFDMNTLMTIAVIGAALIGEWVEGAVVVILFAISEALERFSMDKARQSISSLMAIAPKEALIKRHGEERSVHVSDIQIGDVMIVKPGQKLAMDGVVISGLSTINQAAITGESVPVTKDIADEVFAGTLNEEGFLEVEVTKRAEDTTIAKIIHLVEEAQAEKAPSQKFVDRFAAYYTPAVIVLAILVMTVPPLTMGAPWDQWIYLGLATLVVGCPCALVISTPIAVVTAIGNAARNGVLIKGGIHLEEAGGLKAIAFDKTGTLTMGTPAVTDIITFSRAEHDLLSLAASLEKSSQHPLASAIMRKAKDEQIAIQDVFEFQSITGKGVAARIDDVRYYAGSPDLFTELNIELTASSAEMIDQLQTDGKTVMVFGTDLGIEGLIAAADEVRPVAKSVIRDLNQMGIDTVMLTGDNERTATAIGKQAGVTEVESKLLPEDKLNHIHRLREGKKHIAMVGDGVNDAPALAAANLGIAMGGAGTDTALETADIALMSDDLSKLPYTVSLSRKALRIIKQNISFSLGLKALALLLVIPGWLTLWIAILADMGATLLVTANSLRLMRNDKKHPDHY
ncbi:Lead, cadmium, zinc and mercury transporting ATPase / Copper-translocating P-type ATPase [Salisediminibacterium beveridgei]|uniref:Cd(2+)-exporting ATPase n=1 Tax=Salisediminibacterium beveridgei TaxID=632773 RepID=A0A1D7QZ83_9BACI|nr:Lead, cadmium, zinc and mercury transporting ATPase / Copper-translocating P-type ATPase [Salisediminibacterium beveridgei]